MKKTKYLFMLPVLFFCACNDFLNIDVYQNIPTADAYKTVQDVQNGMHGAYYALGASAFYGRNVVALGDLASDNAVADPSTGHFVNLNRYAFSDTEGTLEDIWNGGYRIMDRTTRTIQGANALLANAEALRLTKQDISDLYSYMAQCYGLRALAAHALVTIFGLPYDASQADNPGIVLLKDEPIQPFTQVKRATVQETYIQINSDIQAAQDAYGKSSSNPNAFFMNRAAIYALEARVALHMHEYRRAGEAADSAINISGKTPVAKAEDYINMWSSIAISNEDIFTIPKSEDDNLSSNSLNTLYNSYKCALTRNLSNIFDSTDIRRGLIMIDTRGNIHPKKFDGIPTSQAVSNIPVFRISEMYIISAESKILSNEEGSLERLLAVTGRNTKITSDSLQKLNRESLLQFIAQERRREFFQEGFRWYDARRTQEKINVSNDQYSQFDVAKFVYPVPADEINAGFGVTQNSGWQDNMPKD